MRLLFIDTETTGVDPNTAEIVEMATLSTEAGPTINLSTYAEFVGSGVIKSERYKPVNGIPLGAMAVHHITEEDVEHCAYFPKQSAINALWKYDFIIGHNVLFDLAMVGDVGVPHICTMRLAKAAFPGLDTYKLTACMYHVDKDIARSMARLAHCAEVDVEMCARVFLAACRALNISTVAEAHAISERARIPLEMAFGKYRGTPIKQLPKNYLRGLYQNAVTLDPIEKQTYGYLGGILSSGQVHHSIIDVYS